ncbi:MAG: glycosyltransferase family 39 protein [Proteobacteria bacterium]|nr:glycosyltransferase family 39 protein [Pseudomonadota bacterium]
MKAILHFLQLERWWPACSLCIGVLLVLPGLGGHGFWEPHEMRIADSARERFGDKHETSEQANVGPEQGSERDKRSPGQRTTRTGASRSSPPSGPPLTEWSVGKSFAYMHAYVESAEFVARLPLAIMGLITVAVGFFLGRRLAGPRAGLLSALVLVSFPLVLLQSRQLMSHIGAVAGSGLVVLGLVGLIWPVERRPRWLCAVDLALVGIGAVLSYYAAGLLLGIVAPVGAVALACIGALFGHVSETTTHLPSHMSGRSSWQSDVAVVWLWRALGVVLAGLVVFAVSIESVSLSIAVAGAGIVAALAALTRPLADQGRTVPTGRLMSRSGVRAHAQRARPNAYSVRWRLWVAAVALGAMAVGALGYVLAQVFELRHAIPGERALFGYSLMPAERYVEAIGGTWKLRDDLNITFDSLFEQIAYGLFPWSALAPIAMVHLATVPRRGRQTWGGFVLFAWAAIAWVVAAVTARKVGMVLYPALVAIAVGLGLWLDNLLEARHRADATAESDPYALTEFGLSLRLPLSALFVVLAVLVLGKDMLAFPDKLVSLTSASPIKYPEHAALFKIGLKYWPFGFGILFAGCLGTGLVLWQRCRRDCDPASIQYYAGRFGIHGAVAIGLVFALFMAHGWLSTLSQKLSSKHIFSVYQDLRGDGDELGVMGRPGSGPEYYAGASLTRLANTNKLAEFLRKSRRVFALVPAARLCSIHSTLGRGNTKYYALDDSNAKFLLLSNRLEDGESDINRLASTIVRRQPESIPTRVRVNYDNKIELIGFDVPAAVGRRDKFTARFFYKILKPVGGTWKVFVHFDGGSLRFQGDHKPADSVGCATSFWKPGDYIVDKFNVIAGDVAYARTKYDIHVGFFRGSHGNWKNMKVVSAHDGSGKKLTIDADNRVRIGQIDVN